MRGAIGLLARLCVGDCVEAQWIVMRLVWAYRS